MSLEVLDNRIDDLLHSLNYRSLSNELKTV
jgi:hypothetical protein